MGRARDAGPPVSEAPRLAPGVHLVGEQKGTGFQEGQWLAEHDGRYIQL